MEYSAAPEIWQLESRTYGGSAGQSGALGLGPVAVEALVRRKRRVEPFEGLNWQRKWQRTPELRETSSEVPAFVGLKHGLESR